MKDLIKIKINKSTNESWYCNQIGSEFMVRDYDKTYWCLAEKNELGENYFFVKSDCTVLDESQPEPKSAKTEYVPACSQTDELYLHMFEKHRLLLNDAELKIIIEIANRSRVKPVQVDTPIERIPFDLGKWNSGKYDVVTGINTKAFIHRVDMVNDINFPILYSFKKGELDLFELANVDGISYNYQKYKENIDLYLIQKTRTVWVNVYQGAIEYRSKDDAISAVEVSGKSKRYIETISITKPIE